MYRSVHFLKVKHLLYVLMLLGYQFSLAQLTRFEKSNGKETATYREVIQFYHSLKGKKLQMKTMGNTDAGYPLHLVLLSNDGFEKVKWKKEGKVIILINNGIHPGEPDGVDASMLLARDVINNKIKLPKNVVIGIIPVYNIGGCLNRNSTTRIMQNGPAEYGFRGNSQNLDLNRDFIKCDSKEAGSFAEIFHWLNPDIFIDNHVSDGADYQHAITLITTQYEKLGDTLGNYLKNRFEPAIYGSMKKKGWDMIPYLDFEFLDPAKGTKMFLETPRYSSGYAALFQTLSFITETHMLKPYTQRVQSTYDLMVSFITEAAVQATELHKKRSIAKQLMQQKTDFPLAWQCDTSLSGNIAFKGYEKEYIKSEATGLTRYRFNHAQPFEANIKYYNYYKGVNVVKKPMAYIIPKGWYAVAEQLQKHNIKVERFRRDTSLTVNAYHIDQYKSSAFPYEKHHKNSNIKTTTFTKTIAFEQGDYLIYTNQPGARFIVEALEPTGEDGYFAWNYFDAILQQKEGYSNYRWEDLAAATLQEQPLLEQKLSTKKASDSSFANNADAILDFIFKESKYYEKSHLWYPVYRWEKE